MKKKSVIWLFLSVFLIALGASSIVNHTNAATSSSDYYFTTTNSDSDTEPGSTYELEQSEESIFIKNTSTGITTSNTTISWESSNETVITVDDNNSTSTKMYRQGPGYCKITAFLTVTEDGTTTEYAFSLIIHVKMELKLAKDKTTTYPDYTDLKTVFTDQSSDSQGCLIIDEYVPNGTNNDTEQIVLKYTDSTDASYESVEVESSNDQVAVCAKTDDGELIVTPTGSGYCEITIKTTTSGSSGTVDTITVKVFVRPKVNITSDSTSTDSSDWIGGSGDIDGTLTTSGSNFSIYSNATAATNLSWEVTDSSGSTLSSDSSVFTYSLSSISGAMKVTGAKAGTYTVTAYASSSISSTTAQYLYFSITVIVPVEFPTSIVMNVGDTYDLLENLNVASASFFASISSSATQYVSVNSTTAVLTAKATTDSAVTITIKYVQDSTTLTQTISVTVIDAISISMTDATIYTGGTLALIATVAENTTGTVTWTSSDSSIASVEGSGEDCVVTGVATGSCTITASIVINGVTKTATCTVLVQQSVTSIVIDPSSKTIDIGEKATLSATVTPSDLLGVSLTWISSDTSIVSISESGSKYVVIEGVAGGTAVITAINQENVVVGFCKVTVSQPVTGITLSDTSVTISLTESSFKLTATITPTDATNQNVTWSTTNSSVIKVSSTGKVTLVAAGTASIIATSEDDATITATCNVTVTRPVTGITIDESTKSMAVGETAKLTYTIIPTTAYDTSVTWKSSNTSVATVSSAGKVTAVAVGTAVITVTTTDGSYSKTCTITVTRSATAITLDKSTLTLKVNKSYTFTVTITPSDSTDTLSWESSNTSVATVSSTGKVTAKAKGSAIIIVKTSKGLTAYCTVKVTQPPTGLTLNYSQKTLTVKDTFKLKATVLPTNASSQKVTYTSSNTKVAKVSSKGVVTGVKGGTAVITVTTKNGKYSETCVVTVKELVTSVSMKSSYKLGKGKSHTLKATVKTNSATTTKLKWTSSNTKVVTVDQNGKITGKALGKATITAYATDGSGAKATCTVRVVTQVTSVTVNKTAVTIVEGKSKKVKATVKPSNATYKSLTWTSSDETVATVSSKGKITAIKEGTCVVTATAKDSSKKSAKVIVTVTKKVSATSVTVADQTLVLTSGETKTVQTVMSPANTTDGYTWSSDNNTVATVNKKTGKIVAKSVGTATITVMTDSGKTAKISVTVVGLSKTSLTLEQYSTHTLWVEGTTDVTWDVEDPEIATVSSGKVTTRAIGTTRIIATVNGRKLYCTLTVTKIK